MSSYEVEYIGPHTLYRGDCMEMLGQLQADAVVSDPPYGMGFAHDGRGKGIWARRFPGAIVGDDCPFDPTPWIAFNDALLWGANHYASRLPSSAGWLVWDKKLGLKEDSFSDGEMAWHKCGTRLMIFRYLWNGLLAHEKLEKRLHSKQKPLALMLWCLGFIKGHHILDPYMGSATTGVACAQLGRIFTGIEIDRAYFDIACQRMHAAMAQPDLFINQPTAATQQRLFEGTP